MNATLIVIVDICIALHECLEVGLHLGNVRPPSCTFRDLHGVQNPSEANMTVVTVLNGCLHKCYVVKLNSHISVATTFLLFKELYSGNYEYHPFDELWAAIEAAKGSKPHPVQDWLAEEGSCKPWRLHNRLGRKLEFLMGAHTI